MRAQSLSAKRSNTVETNNYIFSLRMFSVKDSADGFVRLIKMVRTLSVKVDLPAGGNQDEGAGPKPERARDVFILIGGYLVGIAGLYTNYFPTLLVTTAVLVDLFGTVWLLFVFYAWKTRRQPRLTLKVGKSVSLSTIACLILMATLTWMAFRPPGLHRQPSTEACVYDVHAGVSVPVIKGGSITQKFYASADRINAISVIIGIDSRIGNPGDRHPITLRVQSDQEHVDQTLAADNIVNNGFTRFNFPEPLLIKNRNALFVMRIVNESPSPIGIYIKIPDQSDTIHSADDGIYVVGHLGQEPGYIKPDFALSGCVAGRAD